MKQGNNNMLKVMWKPSARSPAKEMDMETKKANKVAEGLAESK